jgi:hypothetical protein
MKKASKLETKKGKRWLRCNLTSTELLAAGKAQADAAMNLIALENDRKRVADDFKAKVSAVESTLQVLASTVSTGYEYRNVTCTETLGVPECDKKTVTRDDTGEQVAVEDMTQADLQRELLKMDEDEPARVTSADAN